MSSYLRSSNTSFRQLKPISQSQISSSSTLKVSHNLSSSQLLNKSKMSFLRKPTHQKSISTLSASRAVHSQMKEKEIDKLDLPQRQYEFIYLKIDELYKGFIINLVCAQKEISQIKINNQSIQVLKNQIKHIFNIPQNKQAKYIKILFSFMKNIQFGIKIKSVLSKFKLNSISIDYIEDQSIEINPSQLIQQAEELRKRKFSSLSQSSLKPRTSLKINDVKKLFIHHQKQVLSKSRFQNLSQSQIDIMKFGNNVTGDKEKIEQQKLKSALFFKKQNQQKHQTYHKPFQNKTNTNLNNNNCYNKNNINNPITPINKRNIKNKSELDINPNSFDDLQNINQYSSVKNISKPNNQYFFRRKVQPTTYSQLAVSKITNKSRIQ